MTLSAHQIIATLSGVTNAEIRGDQICVGIWRMQIIGDQLTLPSARPLDDPHRDARDKAMDARRGFARC